MKKAMAVMLAIILMFSIVACSSGPQPSQGGGDSEDSGDGYQKVRIKVHFAGTDRGTDGWVAHRMKEILAERSGGAIVLEPYGNCQLSGGSMERGFEMFMEGSAFEMAIINMPQASTIDRSFNVTSIPFSFATYEDAYKMADSTGGEWAKKAYGELGITYLNLFSNSIMHMTNNKHEIKSPEDVKSLKMRTAGEVQMSLMRDLGADPVQMNWSEVYTAMQTGTIDGHMNGFQTIESANIHEVQKYLTTMGVLWSPYCILYNTMQWEKLEPKTQQLIKEVADECALWARNELSEIENEIRQRFIDTGVVITDLTPEQRQAFVDAVSNTRQKYMEICGQEACEAWGINLGH